MKEPEFDYSIKYIIIGNSGTGKSCLLYRYMNNVFNDKLSSSLTCEYSTKILKIKNDKIKLDIWDTAGNEKFHSITRSYSNMEE